MDRLRRFVRVLHIVIAASLMLQVCGPWLASPGPAQAAVLAQTPGLPPPVQSAGSEPDPLVLLRSMLDLTVRQAVGAFGWQVASLSSQLDQASLQVTGMQLTGSGGWRVQALDEKAQPLTLDGLLTFAIEGQGYGSAITQAACKLKGTLRGVETELVLDSTASGESGMGGPKQTGTLTLRLTRSGQVSQATAKISGETRLVAYGLAQNVVQSTFDRDGKVSRFTHVLTVRGLGRGESELWLRVAPTGAAETTSERTMEQHYFQRVDGDRVTQYMDRFNLHVAGKSYSLQQAAILTGAPGRDLSYDLVLVDQTGKTQH